MQPSQDRRQQHQRTGRFQAEAMLAVNDYVSAALMHQPGLAIEPDLRLIEEGYLTSLEALSLVMFLEEHFRIAIDPEEVSEDNFATLDSISRLVASKME